MPSVTFDEPITLSTVFRNMSSSNLVSLDLLAALVGVSSGIAIHVGLFIKGEWHFRAPDILRSYLGVLGCFAASRLLLQDFGWAEVIATKLLQASLFHIIGLISSILVYRGLFHRLNKANFPGPWWARYTKICHIWEARKSRNHLYLHRLFEQYGDVVRTGKI